MTLGFGFAFLAGVLSVLSPCVLPILPIILGAARTQHRLGPTALACGLALSFVVIGLFLATIGFSLGMDSGALRRPAAALLIAIGAVLMLPPLQARFAVMAGPVGRWTDARFGDVSRDGLGGQFALGVLLGAIWSPCVGPTLGAASALAAGGRDLGQVAVTMLLFGLGAAVPLILLGTVSREIVLRWRGRMLSAGTGLRTALGVLLVAGGFLILSGLDHRLEAALVDASPPWLTELTTSF